MSGPQTAQARATLAASPSNVGESACRKARSRVPAVLLSAISAACEVSGRSACRARSSTGIVAWHARCRPATHKRRRTPRLSAPSARNHGAVRGGAGQPGDPVRCDRRWGTCGAHPEACAERTPRPPRLRASMPRLRPTEMPRVRRNPTVAFSCKGRGYARRAWDGG